jgi:hypothetical protein
MLYLLCPCALKLKNGYVCRSKTTCTLYSKVSVYLSALCMSSIGVLQFSTHVPVCPPAPCSMYLCAQVLYACICMCAAVLFTCICVPECSVHVSLCAARCSICTCIRVPRCSIHVSVRPSALKMYLCAQVLYTCTCVPRCSKHVPLCSSALYIHLNATSAQYKYLCAPVL